MHSPKTIASLITDNITVSSEYLLQQFLTEHEDIRYGSFRTFCIGHGIIVEEHEFLDLLKSDQSYIFHEYSDADGCYWVPAIAEGYVSNMLPGDWDDFGDDQIEGITNTAFGDGAQQQPMDFAPLSNAQISDNPESEQISDEEELEGSEEDPGLPDFDTRVRHRPSRSTKELESVEPDDRLIEQENQENQTDDFGPVISRSYGIVDSWKGK